MATPRRSLGVSRLNARIHPLHRNASRVSVAQLLRVELQNKGRPTVSQGLSVTISNSRRCRSQLHSGRSLALGQKSPVAFVKKRQQVGIFLGSPTMPGKIDTPSFPSAFQRDRARRHAAKFHPQSSTELGTRRCSAVFGRAPSAARRTAYDFVGSSDSSRRTKARSRGP